MVTVFFSILNQMEFHLVQNRKENSHHDHILFNVKGIGNKVYSVWDGCTPMLLKQFPNGIEVALKPLGTIYSAMIFAGFQWAMNCPHMMPRVGSL